MAKPELFSATSLMDGDEVITQQSTMASLTSTFKIVPFWVRDCPERWQAQWGNRWSDIRTVLLELPEIANKTLVDKFNFRAKGLDDVLEVARKEKWDSFADAFVINFSCDISWA